MLFHTADESPEHACVHARLPAGLLSCHYHALASVFNQHSLLLLLLLPLPLLLLLLPLPLLPLHPYCCVQALCRDARCVPAGGASELEMARQVQQGVERGGQGVTCVGCCFLFRG
jgi:hypothetical protein